MKSHKLNFVILIFTLSFIFVSAVYSEDQTKSFPKYYCRLTLPDETWSWDDSDKTPNVLAVARSENGLILLFGAYPLKSDQTISDKFIAGIEQGQLQRPGVSKTGSRKLTYCGVPSYQLETFISEINTHSIKRFFNGHGYSYFLGIMYSGDYTGQTSTLEQMFDCFTFTSPPVVKIRPETTDYEIGRWIGNITGNVIILVVLGYAVFVIVRKLRRKPK